MRLEPGSKATHGAPLPIPILTLSAPQDDAQRALDEHGDSSARTSPMLDLWQNNLHPDVRDTGTALAHAGLPLHKYAQALNSSQCFAMNLFLPFIAGNAAPLASFLSERLGRTVDVQGIDLEYYGSGDILCEIAGHQPTGDEKLTAADVVIHVTDKSGQQGLVVVEVKLSELGFTHCGGINSRGNRDRAACDSRELMFRSPERCYLNRPYRAQRDRRYWTIFAQSHGDLATAFPGAMTPGCPFATEWQQPMRNHALCLGHLHADRATFWMLALVHHDDNPDVAGPWDAYRDATIDKQHIQRWPASSLIGCIAQALPVSSPPIHTWLQQRYFLEDSP